MTEAEWLTNAGPIGMIQFLKGKASDRKLRLYACACARRTWEQPPEKSYHCAVETAERFAEGTATAEELAVARRAARKISLEWARMHPDDRRQYAQIAPADAASPCPYDAAVTGSLDAGYGDCDGDWNPESPLNSELAWLARDIFGNPFRPITLSPPWLTSNVVSLANQMYDTRDFSAMPILADALQDAGCDNETILEHCHGPGPHVRGCWVVDGCLNKS